MSKNELFEFEIVEKGLYSASFEKVEEGELGRSGIVVRIFSEELRYTSPKFYFQAWGAGLESEERLSGAYIMLYKALHMLEAYEEIGHDGGDMNAIIKIFATA